MEAKQANIRNKQATLASLT